MINLPKRFETSRLVGRCPRIEDAVEIFNGYAQDTEVTKYMIWRPYENIGQLRVWLEGVISMFGNTHTDYVLAPKDNENAVVGMISMRLANSKVDYGYVLRRDAWGYGFATEALSYLVDWALKQEEIYRAWAVCDIENSASARVMEKAGMQKEGILRKWMVHPNISDKPRDVLCYSKIK